MREFKDDKALIAELKKENNVYRDEYNTCILERRKLSHENSELKSLLAERAQTMYSLFLVVGVGIFIACLGESYHWGRSDTVNLQFGWGIGAFCTSAVWRVFTEKVSLGTKQKVNQLWREGWDFVIEWGIFVPCGGMACLVMYPCKGLWFLAKWPYRLLNRLLKG